MTRVTVFQNQVKWQGQGDNVKIMVPSDCII